MVDGTAKYVKYTEADLNQHITELYQKAYQDIVQTYAKRDAASADLFHREDARVRKAIALSEKRFKAELKIIETQYRKEEITAAEHQKRVEKAEKEIQTIMDHVRFSFAEMGVE